MRKAPRPVEAPVRQVVHRFVGTVASQVDLWTGIEHQAFHAFQRQSVRRHTPGSTRAYDNNIVSFAALFHLQGPGRAAFRMTWSESRCHLYAAEFDGLFIAESAVNFDRLVSQSIAEVKIAFAAIG